LPSARPGDGVQQRVQDHHPRQGQPRRLPHNGIDPVPIACQMVQAFQTIISRNKKPVDAGVISVTMIHAGEATNVMPDSCELQGTVRTFTLRCWT
jgi:metal-dependent amidase/aminoacylase/carboxypeptidase family protein